MTTTVPSINGGDLPFNQNINILVVDDEPGIRMLLKDVLEEYFAQIVVVPSAQDAFRYLGVGQSIKADPQVDLILMDVAMPEMDGIEACRKIKSDETLRDIPIIIETVMDSTEPLRKAFAAGAMDYFTISLGVASSLPVQNSVSRDLVSKVDQAMYRAKNRGWDRVVEWETRDRHLT